MIPTHLLRVRCGCAFNVTKDEADSVASGRFWPCPKHGNQSFKFSKPLADKRPEPADPRPGEKRLTAREEARALVDQVFAVRADAKLATEQVVALQKHLAGLREQEDALVEKLATEHGLFYNPDR